MSFVEPVRLTLLWKLWDREIGILEIKVNDKADAHWWICGMASERAKAKYFLRYVQRSTEFGGVALELVGSADKGHGEEVPEAELRTSSKTAVPWKELPMADGKVVAFESEAGVKRFVKRKTKTAVTELERGCC